MPRPPNSSPRYAPEVQDQINKRLTLNLLIQGAAIHTCLGAHYLVKDELSELNPNLPALYDKFAVNVTLAQWIGDIILFLGRPKRFWSNLADSDHPFARSKLFVRHGGAMSDAAYRFAQQHAKAKRTHRIPGLHILSAYGLITRVLLSEKDHHRRLEELAVRAASEIWTIPEDRLTARITTQTEFGDVKPPKTLGGRIYRHAAAGWSGVERRQGKFIVVARAWSWTLLIHELVKGTAELISLHGLNELDDNTYATVMQEADQVDHEIWMLQAGGDLWRRFLKIAPRDIPLSVTLMNVARMNPEYLESLMLTVFEAPDTAMRTLALVCQDNDP